jgi:hypothetical protein
MHPHALVVRDVRAGRFKIAGAGLSWGTHAWRGLETPLVWTLEVC